MKNDDVIETLNILIKICNDGTAGFNACAENAKITSSKLKNLLADRAHDCTQAAITLSALVTELGGTPATGTTAIGALHRGWLNVKAAVAGKTDSHVLEECERGEDAAKLAYQKALNENLPASIREVVEKQYKGVLKNHDLIKSLRDEARASQN